MRRSTQTAQAQRRAYPKIDPATQGSTRPCLDGCGKTVTGKQAFYDAACRKRYQRAQEAKNAAALATPAAKISAANTAAIPADPKTEATPTK